MMRKMGMFRQVGIASMVLAASSALPGYAGAAPMGTLTQLYDGTMLPDTAVVTFTRTEELWNHVDVARGTKVSALPVSTETFPQIHFTDHGKTFDLYDYMADNRVAGLLVLKDGKIAFEDYELGIGPDTRWMSASMAKSISSTLVGAAIRDGYIHSIDDPLTRYVPALRGSGYDGVSVRNLLMMASGVRWSEIYTDPNSDRRHLLARQAEGKAGTVVDFMRTLPRAAAPGTVWNYNTGESYLVGALLTGAVKKPINQYLSEKIWAPAGMEQGAAWWAESTGGMPYTGSGMVATLRDYGRFGLIAMNGGVVDGKQIVPDGWFAEAGVPHMLGGKKVDYGYMWWIPDQTDPVHRGAFQAEGIYGQFTYVNPREHVVIVVLSARPKPSSRSRAELSDAAFFSAVTTALRK
jgi:CubicO group peptidase (beta-lactamase class C family)